MMLIEPQSLRSLKCNSPQDVPRSRRYPDTRRMKNHLTSNDCWNKRIRKEWQGICHSFPALLRSIRVSEVDKGTRRASYPSRVPWRSRTPSRPGQFLRKPLQTAFVMVLSATTLPFLFFFFFPCSAVFNLLFIWYGNYISCHHMFAQAPTILRTYGTVGVEQYRM